MWQLQYLRALDLAADLLAEADRERLVREARQSERPVGVVRRGIAAGARSVERVAVTVACWADPRPA